eukprot:2171446-Pyramimonas_sp.AAC.1
MALTSQSRTGRPHGKACLPNPSSDHPSRSGYIPAFSGHPTFDPSASERPAALPMDAPAFLDYYAQ